MSFYFALNRGDKVAEDIGELAVKIAMEDSSFQQGMQNLKRSMNVIDSSFKESVSGLKNWGGSLDGLKANFQALSDKINVQKQIVEQYQEQLNKSKANLENNSQAMMELKSKVELAKVAWEESKSSLGANAEATLKLKKDFEDLNKQYTDQENKVRNSSKSVEGYTIQVNNANGKLKSMEMELQGVSKQLDESNKKQSLFGKVTEKLGINADTLKTAIGTVGIAAGTFLKSAVDSATSAQKSTEQLTNLLKNQGVTAGAAKKDINDFTSSITQMSDYSAGEAKEALQILTQKGISAGEALKQESTIANVAAGTNQSLSDAANLVADAYHGKMRALVSLGIVTQQEIKNNTAAQKAEQLQTEIEDKIKEKYGETTIATKLLSDMYNHKTESLVEAGIATKAEAKTLSEASKHALSMAEIQDRLNKRFKGAAEGDLKTYSGQLKEMQNELNSSKVQIGNALLPVLTQLALAFAEIIKPIAGFIAAHPKFSAAVLGIVAVIGTLIGGLSVLNTITAVFGITLDAAILPTIGLVVLAIAAVAAAAFLLVKYWGPISSFFKKLWKDVSKGTISAWNKISNFFKGLWDWISNFFKQWGTIILAVISPFIGIPILIIQHWSQIKTFFINLYSKLKTKVSSIFSDILETIKNSFNTAVSFIKGLPETLYKLGVNIFTSLKNGIWSVLKGIGSLIKNGFNSAISFIKKLPTDALKWGRDFIDGLIKGIKGALGKIGDAVKSVANTIRSFLHFSVPDEGPLKDYESWMPDFLKGMATGIDKNKKLVTNAIKGLSTDINVGMKLNPAAVMQDSTGNISNQGSLKQVNVTINFNGSYTFADRKDIDYFMNQAALLVQRKK